MPSKNKSTANSWSRVFKPYLFVITAWTLYRASFHTSVWLEETVVKGGFFLLPLVLFPLKTKKMLGELGITTKNFFPSVYLGVGLGVVLGLVGQFGNIVRHGSVVLSGYSLSSGNVGAFLILSLITAFWEQLLFSGYFLKKIGTVVKDEPIQVGLSGLLFSVIHLPALVILQRQSVDQLVFSGMLLLLLGIGTSILRLRQHNLIAPIMTHAMWGVTVFLFR